MAEPAENKAIPQPDDGQSLRRLASLLRPFGGKLLVAVGALIGLALINMALPWFIGLLFDSVFPEKKWGLLTLILIAILGVYIGRNVLYFASKFTAVAVGEHVSFSVRNRLFEQLQQMNLQFYKQNKPGRISSRLMDDSHVIQSFIQDDLPTTMGALFQFLVLLAVIYAVNWQLAIVSTIVLPLHLFAFFRFRRSIKTASRAAAEQLSIVHGSLIEKFLGAEVVKGFTGEQREGQAFTRAIDISRESQIRSKKYHVTQKIVADLIVGLGTVALLGFGAYQVMGPPEMQKGQFIMFWCYVVMLYPTVLELMSGFSKLTRATASVDRVFEILHQPSSEASTAGTIFKPIRGHIRFDDVSFAYREGQPTLKHVSIEVKPGQVCAIVGPSGAGKSTLVSLLPRFIDPSQGHVLLDGLDVRQIDLKHLRASVGIAFQECFLFNTTVLENLRYANPNASMNQIMEVARRTGSQQFIENLPDGLNTVVGEDGVSLSRGEKQRITLMRAMLKNPKVLILDEATASIDTASEAQIIPAILEFMQGKTTLMITHRPDLLQHADIVAQIVDGELVYHGPAQGYTVPQPPPPMVLPAEPGVEQVQPTRQFWRGLNAVLLALTLGVAMFAGQRALADDDDAPAEAVTTEAVEAPPAAAPEAEPVAEPDAPAEPDAAPPAGDAAPPVDDAAPPAVDAAPLASGRFISMPSLSATEAAEVVEIIAVRLQTDQGYEPADRSAQPFVGEPPAELRGLVMLMRPTEAGTKLIALGYRTFRSQPVHIWLFAVTVQPDERRMANGDLLVAQELINEALKSSEEKAASLTVADLSVGMVTLSYIEADRCLALLKTLGYQTIEYRAAGAGVGKAQVIDPMRPVDPAQLPIVLSMPGTDNTDLVGGDQVRTGAFGLANPSYASELKNLTSGAPLMQLMVLYDPGRPEQYAELVTRIRSDIDVAARQILIEAMVLEISEIGLQKLGVEWELESPGGNVESLTLGRVPNFSARNDEVPTADIGLRNVFGEFSVKIEALIRNRQAEILSRPSVLTIDNRQASIRVGEDIPVATTISGLTSSDKLSFDVKYIPVGIVLNVRPRMAADGEEVTLQIDAMVSAQVPGQDLVVLDNSGQELLRAPRISTRRVQTYSRINNNTPFIIGGLVSKDATEQIDKVPLLGDIPLIGDALFKTRQNDNLKREVIIVITPFILPDDQVVGRNLPKDEDTFDSFGNRLFRDAYRIRAEDVFDLAFLRQNAQLRQMREVVAHIVAQNADLAEVHPFSRFVDERIPGEYILVYRQMYEVIKRREIEKNMDLGRVIFFHPDEDSESGFDVRFLAQYAQELAGTTADVHTAADLPFTGRLQGKAIQLTYTMRQRDADARAILNQPVPEVSIVDCPDSQTWSRMLWELNQRDEDGRQRYTILLRTTKDLIRLQHAIVLKGTVQLNAARNSLSLSNFSIGRQLLMPSISPDKVYLVDDEVARYFFYTELYYPAVLQRLDRTIRQLMDHLSDPQFANQYLRGWSQPIDLPDDR